MSSIWDGEDTLVQAILILSTLGSVNWGLVEFADYNAVDQLGAAAGEPVVATAIYGAVAICGVITLADYLGVYDATDVVDSVRGDAS